MQVQNQYKNKYIEKIMIKKTKTEINFDYMINK